MIKRFRSSICSFNECILVGAFSPLGTTNTKLLKDINMLRLIFIVKNADFF